MSIVLIPQMVRDALANCADGFLVYTDVTTYQVWVSPEKVREIGGLMLFAQKVIPLILSRSNGKIEKIPHHSFGNEMIRMTFVLSYPESIASFTHEVVNELVRECIHDVSIRIAG